jgi:hypothetical protein
MGSSEAPETEVWLLYAYTLPTTPVTSNPFNNYSTSLHGNVIQLSLYTKLCNQMGLSKQVDFILCDISSRRGSVYMLLISYFFGSNDALYSTEST